MLSREAMYGAGVAATAKPGSSTPTTDLAPSIPSATNDHYTPDEKYQHDRDKPPKEKHSRWFLVRDIGIITHVGSNAISIVSPLTIASGQQVYDFTENPEFLAVTLLANNGANAQLLLWLGDGGGHPIRIGNGG